MANTYKNIVITPNIGNTSDPRVQFSGGNTSANTDINLYVYPTSNGTLSFEGSAGQLFSITNDLANLIFSVSDVSGIPSLEVYANSLISVAPFGGNVVFGNTSELILSPGAGIYANGGLGSAGQVLTSNGSSIYWSTAASGSGTVTSVATGNGMTGGPITTTGTVSVLANTGIVANSTGTFVNATYIGTLTANNANNLNGQAASFYTNATNITTGTLPYAQIPANIVNTTANFTISGIHTMSAGANAIILSNATQNWIWWNTVGVAAPTATTRSAGTKLVLYPSVAADAVDFAIGIESGTLWQSVSSPNGGVFRWYANTTNFMFANTTGLYHTGLVNAASYTVGTAFTANSTVVNAVSYNVGTFIVANSTVVNATHLSGVAGASYVQNTDSRTLSGNLVFSGSNTTVNAEFRVVNSAANVFFAAANGNVGIANNTPQEKLHVAGALITAGATVANKTSSGSLDFNAGSARIISWGAVGTNGLFGIWTGSGGLGATERLRIDTSGNVGISNTTPAHRLRVDGTTSLAGAVSDITTLAAGNTTITGFMNVTSTGQFGGNVVISGANNTVNAVFRVVNATANVVIAAASGVTTFSSIAETVFTITDGAAVDINPANGNIQLWTLGANRTPTASSFAAGQSVTLMILDGTAFAVTWTTIGVTWVGGSAPTLDATRYTVIELWKVGSIVYGAFVGYA